MLRTTLLAPTAALVLALSALACGQEAPGAAPRERPFDDAFVAARYAEAVEALAEGAGIHLPREVPVVVLTASEALERRQAFARELEEHSGLTIAMDMLADFVFSEAMLGRYLPDEQAVYIIEDVVLRESRGDAEEAEVLFFNVLAHELVHAYDDQVYGVLPGAAELLRYATEPEGLLEVQALMSLFEGRATYAAELACAAAGRPMALPIPTVEAARRHRLVAGGDGLGSQVGAGLVNLVGRAKLVQYAYGREFAKQAYAFGGERFFGEVFDSLPLSLAELEDFPRFKVRWAEELAARLEADESRESDESDESGPPREAGAGSEAPGGERGGAEGDGAADPG